MGFDYIDRDVSLQYAFIRIPKAMMDPDGSNLYPVDPRCSTVSFWTVCLCP